MFFDSAKARAELGYEPGPIDVAIRAAIEYFRATGAVRAAA
jgi:nucleoside-diphosphate-sugar epimerase